MPSLKAPIVALEAENVVVTTKKLMAKTIIFLTAKAAGKDTTAEQAEFQKRVAEFKADFQALLNWAKATGIPLLPSSSPFPCCHPSLFP